MATCSPSVRSLRLAVRRSIRWATDYILPSHNWVPVYQPVVATSSFGTRLYYPTAGGTVSYIDNIDTGGVKTPVRLAFYGLANYQANISGFNSTVFVNTPITADASGNIFFGFRVQGTAPAPLSTTQSGFARIDPNGNATYVLAGTAAGDATIARDSHNSAPAISDDGSTVYVPVKSASTEYYGYLLGLDSTTLATKYKVFLKDPRNGNNAGILDDSTASPTVAPDGDVYFGIMSNPDNGSRGFLLRFSGDLTVRKNSRRIRLGLHAGNRSGKHGAALHRIVSVPDFLQVQQLRQCRRRQRRQPHRPARSQRHADRSAPFRQRTDGDAGGADRHRPDPRLGESRHSERRARMVHQHGRGEPGHEQHLHPERGRTHLPLESGVQFAFAGRHPEFGRGRAVRSHGNRPRRDRLYAERRHNVCAGRPQRSQRPARLLHSRSAQAWYSAKA